MQKVPKLLCREKLPLRGSENISFCKCVIDFDLSSARTDAVRVKGGDFHVQGLSENELWVFFLKKKAVLWSRSVPALLPCDTF